MESLAFPRECPCRTLSGLVAENYSSSAKYSFYETSTLAFEVDLTLTEHAALVVGQSWREKFQAGDLWSRFKDRADWHTFKHLLLDLRSKYFAR